MTDPVKDPVRASKHARLLKRIDTHKANNKFSKEIVALCRAILREHKPEDEVEPEFILEGVRESKDKNLLCYVWFCYLLGVNKDTTTIVLTKAKFLRSTSISSANTMSESDTADLFTPEEDRGAEPFRADTNNPATDIMDTAPK
eukprot:IDg1374t1